MKAQESINPYNLKNLFPLALLLLSISSVILGILFVVPVFIEMFSDFGTPLPALFQFFLTLSVILSSYNGLGCISLLTLVFFIITKTYFQFCKKGSLKTFYISAWMSFALLLILVTSSLFLPSYTLVTIVP